MSLSPQPRPAQHMSSSDSIQDYSVLVALLALSIAKVEIIGLQQPLQDAQKRLDDFLQLYQNFSHVNARGLDPAFAAEWNGSKVTITLDLGKVQDIEAAANTLHGLFALSEKPEKPGIVIIVDFLKREVFQQQSLNLTIKDGVSMTCKASDAVADLFTTMAINRAFLTIPPLCNKELATLHCRHVVQHAVDNLCYFFMGGPKYAYTGLRDTRAFAEEILHEGDRHLINVRLKESEAMRAIGKAGQSVECFEALLDTAKRYIPYEETLYIMQSLAIALIYAGREPEAICHLDHVANAFERLGQEHDYMVARKWAAYGYFHYGSVQDSKRVYTEIRTWAQNNDHARFKTDAQLGLAHIDLENGSIHNALSKYTEVATWRREKLGPNHHDALFPLIMKGICHWKQGESAEAEATFLKVIEDGDAGQTHVGGAEGMLGKLRSGGEPPVWKNGKITY